MKCIMVHAGGDAAFESRLQAGLDLARRFDGHISLVLPRPTQDYVAFDMFGGAHFVAERSDCRGPDIADSRSGPTTGAASSPESASSR